MVNVSGTARRVDHQIAGVAAFAPGTAVTTLAGESLNDTNSLQDPGRILPRTDKEDILQPNFTREYPPYSITILQLKPKP